MDLIILTHMLNILHELAGCTLHMPYQKNADRTLLALWSVLGFPPQAIATLQITRVSTAFPRVRHMEVTLEQD